MGAAVGNMERVPWLINGVMLTGCTDMSRGVRGAIRKGCFCPGHPALPRIKRLGRTKTSDKTVVVLGGFWHGEA
jgi:hypothetical protein